MEPTGSPVNRPRRYDSSGRRRQALENQKVVLDAAQDLFLADGYAATTVAAVAAAAGVSVETVYKQFGGKPGLVRAIRDRALEGAGAEPTERRSDRMRDAEVDPRRIIANWASLSIEVLPRVAPILLVLRSAAGADPALADLRDQLDADRLERMTDNARHLLDRGALRDDLTLEEARDVLFTYSSPELYDLLVLRQRWPLDRYAAFIGDAMTGALLA